jgi:hypothetical protein
VAKEKSLANFSLSPVPPTIRDGLSLGAPVPRPQKSAEHFAQIHVEEVERGILPGIAPVRVPDKINEIRPIAREQIQENLAQLITELAVIPRDVEGFARPKCLDVALVPMGAVPIGKIRIHDETLLGHPSLERHCQTFVKPFRYPQMAQ